MIELFLISCNRYSSFSPLTSSTSFSNRYSILRAFIKMLNGLLLFSSDSRIPKIVFIKIISHEIYKLNTNKRDDNDYFNALQHYRQSWCSVYIKENFYKVQGYRLIKTFI